MTVGVKLFAHFRDLFGGRALSLDLAGGATVADALAALCDTPARRRELFSGAALRPHIVVMVNGSPAALTDPLSPGDTLAVFPLMGGG